MTVGRASLRHPSHAPVTASPIKTKPGNSSRSGPVCGSPAVALRLRRPTLQRVCRVAATARCVRTARSRAAPAGNSTRRRPHVPPRTDSARSLRAAPRGRTRLQWAGQGRSRWTRRNTDGAAALYCASVRRRPRARQLRRRAEPADDAVIHGRYRLQRGHDAQQHDVAHAAAGDEPMQEEKSERQKYSDCSCR